MTLYDVHLYKLYRIKHPNVEADTMEQAIAKAEALPDNWAECIEDAELLITAMVDVVGDEEYEQTRNFDFMKLVEVES